MPRFWLLALLVLVATTCLFGDGIILPPVAAPEVTMPDQRALLVWHDGTETLVIESRFSGQGDRFAWVVPLPSRPEIKPATTGTLPSLQAVFRPRIIPPAALGFLAPALFFCLPLLLLFVFEASRARLIYSRSLAMLFGVIAVFCAIGTVAGFVQNDGGLILFAVLTFVSGGAAWRLWHRPPRIIATWAFSLLMVLLAAMAIPAFSKVRAATGPMAGSLSIERQTIGDYDVAILSGSDASHIAEWLALNGFALPPASAPVLAEHARAGGCFVATKLRRDTAAAQTQATHPLVFTFKTAHPIYPMKLTGTGIRSALDLDLFVFGEAVAHVENLPLRACGRVELVAPSETATGAGKGYSSPPDDDRVQLSHTALRELCAGTTVATRLRGTLEPAQMQQDLTIQWRPFKGPRGLARFTRSDAWGYAALIGLGSLLLGGGVLFACRRPRRPTVRARLWVAAAACGIGLASSFAFPTTAVEYVRTRYAHRHGARLLQASLEIAWDGTDPRSLSEQQIRERLTADFANPDSDLRRHFKALPAYGDAPGQYHLRQLASGGWQVVLIDASGQEHSVQP